MVLQINTECMAVVLMVEQLLKVMAKAEAVVHKLLEAMAIVVIVELAVVLDRAVKVSIMPVAMAVPEAVADMEAVESIQMALAMTIEAVEEALAEFIPKQPIITGH